MGSEIPRPTSWEVKKTGNNEDKLPTSTGACRISATPTQPTSDFGGPGRVWVQFHGIAAPQQIHHRKQRTCLQRGPGDRYAVCPYYPTGNYPPVNKHSNGKSPSWIGNTSSNGGCSIAHILFKGSWENDFFSWWDMLVPRRVIIWYLNFTV